MYYSKQDAILIERIAQIWVNSGGDVEGFELVAEDIIEKIEELSKESL